MNKKKDEGAFLYHTSCPFCGSSDGCAVYSSGTTYCFKCGKWGVLDAPITLTRKRGKVVPQSLLTNLKPILKTTRGIKEETFKKYGYQYGSYRGKSAHVAPYYLKGNLVSQHIRTPDKKFAWTGETKDIELFGQRLWKNSGDYRKRIIITEGEIDCMSVSQSFNNKWPVVSVPNGAQSASKFLKANLEFLEGYEEVVIAFDSDEPGRSAAKECALLFTPGKAKIVDWSPYKDANDILKDGKPSSEITQKIFDAKAYRPDGVISGEDLWEVVKQPLVSGYPIQYPELSRMLMGLRKTEVYMFTAGSGIGKSTVVNEIAYYLMMCHNLKIGVIALEENKKRTAERYLSIFLNQPLHITRVGISEEKLREAFDATVGSGRMFLYDHFGSLDSTNLMMKLRYMVKGLGVDFIILDHISIVVSGLEDSGGDERKDIDRLMTNLKSLAEEANVGILAVVHLKRKDKGKSFNEGRQVSLSDLRGSGALEQLSDAVIALERNQQGKNPNVSKVRVLKNRYTGETGVADLLEYHRDTGRLLVCEEDYDFGNEEDTTEGLSF